MGKIKEKVKAKIVKTIGLSPTEEKLKTEAEIKENVKTTFNLGVDDEVSTEGRLEKYYDDYETKKLILIETLDKKNNLDLSNLNDDEIEDIENARMVNIIFCNPMIQNVCDDHLRLKRSLTSEPQNLLSHLFQWSSGAFTDAASSTSAINRVLGRKGGK
jgi:hypothetical protein